MNTKVRLVRCPKCRLVLPELADVPFYKCGGCGTILQAKNRKEDPMQRNGLDRVSHNEEISSASQEASLPSRGDLVLNRRKKSDQGDAEDCNEELARQRNFPDELPGSPELNCHENEGPSSKVVEYVAGDVHKCPLDKKSDGYENESQDHENILTREGNSCNKLPSSDKLTCLESEIPSLEAREDMEGSAVETREQPELAKYNVDQNRVGKMEMPEVVNSLNENSTFSGCSDHKDKVSSGSEPHASEIKRKHLLHQNIQGHNAEPVENVSCVKEYSSSTELACDEIEKPLAVDSDLDRSPFNESTFSETLMSTDHEQLEQFQKEIPSSFDRISSVDALENLPLNIHGSEPVVDHRDVSKAPISRNFYAYDGSASSCGDDDDDHTPEQLPQLSRRRFKEANHVRPSEYHLDDGCRVNDRLIRESKIQQQAMNFSTTMAGKSQHTPEGRNWNQDERPQSRRCGQFSGGRMRLEKDAYATALPLIYTSSNTVNKHGNPSSYRENMAHHHSSFPPSVPSYPEPNKIELLRMVYELEDQLRKTQIANRTSNRPFPIEAMRDGKHSPLYYDQFPAEGKMCADLNYSRYPVTYNHRKGWPQQRKSSRVPFSEAAAHYRHQADCLCLHCSPQIKHYSSQLPLPSICCNKRHQVAYSSHNCCTAGHSGYSSPVHYTSSEYSQWGREIKSSDRRHKDHEMKKLYLQEKYSKNRHLKPVAGGAPIIACYFCCELLQLPADFLVSKRRFHQLKCSACRKVLKFSLLNQVHVVPFSTEALTPPPSEVDDNIDAINQQNLASTYHSKYCPHTEPISYSDDLGPSFCRSCSTEGESALPPIQLIGTTHNRKMPSNGSFDPTEDRKMKSVSREPPHIENKYSLETIESAGPSSKMSKWRKLSPDIDEVQQTTDSPLHRLMGYSSPSQVIRW